MNNIKVYEKKKKKLPICFMVYNASGTISVIKLFLRVRWLLPPHTWTPYFDDGLFFLFSSVRQAHVYMLTSSNHPGSVFLLDWLPAKAEERTLSYYLTWRWGEKRWIRTFSKGICAKVNVTNSTEIRTQLFNFSSWAVTSMSPAHL